MATQTPVPGATASVNTINPAIQATGPYGGSVPGSAKKPFAGKLSLREAIARGLDYNLGTVGLTIAMQQAHGAAIVSRSSLLPNLNGTLSETVQQTDLKAAGFKFSSPFPGFNIPSIVGPFNYFDLRAHLTQTVADLSALNNYRSAKETLHADEFFAKDAKDLVVLAVGGAYLQAIAAQARVVSAQAQFDAAGALLRADDPAAGSRPRGPDRCEQESRAGADAAAARGHAAERSGETENQSGAPHGPAAE